MFRCSSMDALHCSVLHWLFFLTYDGDGVDLEPPVMHASEEFDVRHRLQQAQKQTRKLNKRPNSKTLKKDKMA